MTIVIVFLDSMHWTPALPEGSLVLSMKQEINTRQVVAVIAASGKMGSTLAKKLSKENYTMLRHSSKTKAV